jgi:hypothetical protein
MPKSQVVPLFNEWLDLMVKAFERLSLAEFKELEDKIISEIQHSRKDQNAH